MTQSDIAWATGSCTYLQPGTDVDGSAQMLLRTSSGISASISLCGYSVVPIDETMLFFANGSPASSHRQRLVGHLRQRL